MRAEVTKFLADDLGLTAEQITALDSQSSIFDGTVARITSFAESRRQLDADRAAVATAQSAAQAANERLNREMLEWTELRANDEPISAKLAKDLEDARAEVARTNERLRVVAQRAGLNPDEVAPVSAVPTSVKPAATDLTGYVKDTDVQARLGTMASYMLDIQPVLSRIQHEHGQLHAGAFLDTAPIIAEIKRRAADKTNQKPLDPQAIWEELHGISAKRIAVADKQRNDELAAAEQRGFERARTEQSVPGSQPIGQGSHSVLFTRPNAGQSKLQRPMAGNRISQAASALATHRYRPAAAKVPA